MREDYYVRLYNMAVEVASEAHKGQEYSEGEPYINHCLRVADRFPFGILKVVAVLHDTLEDVPEEKYKEIFDRMCGMFPSDVFFILDALTRDKKKESYGEYITMKVLESYSATEIKIADMTDNLSNCFDENGDIKEVYFGLAKRYGKYLKMLLKAKR